MDMFKQNNLMKKAEILKVLKIKVFSMIIYLKIMKKKMMLSNNRTTKAHKIRKLKIKMNIWMIMMVKKIFSIQEIDEFFKKLMFLLFCKHFFNNFS